jgi:selenium metabolism protein YedF
MGKRILVVSDRMGRGDDELGRILMRNFLYSLAREENHPIAVMLSNAGVRLACKGSDSVDDLRLLVAAGVTVRACGTCLDYLGLMDELIVGEVGTMPQLTAAVLGADEVVAVG